MSDELKIVLEDVKEKFDTVIEGVNMIREKLDRHEQAEEERFHGMEERLDRHEGRLHGMEERLDRHEGRLHGIEEKLDRHEGHLQRIEDRLTVLQKDFNDHRENTELHTAKKKKKVS